MKMLVISVLMAAFGTAGDAWPQFRGPGARGIGEGKGLPETWSASRNIAWKTPIAGHGWSSPIVWGNSIFLTAVVSSTAKEPPKPGLYFGGERPAPTDEHRWMVYSVDFRTGKLEWEREVHRAVPRSTRHLKNTYASETPVTDGERVYAYFGNVGLFCLDKTGKLLWSRRFEPVNTRNGWGTASSPVLHEGRIYIQNDNEDASLLLALDKLTGKEIWKAARTEKSAWSTPYVWTHSKGTEIVTTGPSRVRSYDLDGRLVWELAGMSSLVIPSPFSDGDLLYVASGYVGDQVRPTYAIRAGAKGDISLAADATKNDFVVWSLPQGAPYNPSPILYQGRFYTLFDRGFFTCHDAATGQEIYGKVRIDPAAGAFTASPWAYNGKIFALSEDGDTYVIEAGPEFKVVGKNTLDEMSMATPAIVGDSLIIRTLSHLYRIRK